MIFRTVGRNSNGCPPIRDEENRNLLWEALKNGTFDFVVSDHSQCVAELKMIEGDLLLESVICL
jgi:dihydroorotase-like cyclic amidohydrolase